MTAISNENHFREALGKLSLAEQRQVGARFVNDVISFADDDRVAFAVRTAENSKATEAELTAAFKGARAAALDYHTRCGADADWKDQAGYFVARAASVITTPEKGATGDEPAWKAAVNCRMANTCILIEGESEAGPREIEKQYAILESYINP